MRDNYASASAVPRQHLESAPKPIEEVRVPERVQRRCQCCRLNQAFADRGDGQSRRSDHICSRCEFHRWPHDELQRALDHETLVREQLDACKSWATRTEKEVTHRRGQVRAAYELTDRERQMQKRAFELIGTINDLHIVRPSGDCTCGKRNCPTAILIYQRWVQDRVDS